MPRDKFDASRYSIQVPANHAHSRHHRVSFNVLLKTEMLKIKGTVVDVESHDTLLIEVDFVGKFNTRNLPDVVTVRFSELSPPYTKNLTPTEAVDALRNSILGAYVSANIGGPDASEVFIGKVRREEPSFRRRSNH